MAPHHEHNAFDTQICKNVGDRCVLSTVIRQTKCTVGIYCIKTRFLPQTHELLADFLPHGIDRPVPVMHSLCLQLVHFDNNVGADAHAYCVYQQLLAHFDSNRSAAVKFPLKSIGIKTSVPHFVYIVCIWQYL